MTATDGRLPPFAADELGILGPRPKQQIRYTVTSESTSLAKGDHALDRRATFQGLCISNDGESDI